MSKMVFGKYIPLDSLVHKLDPRAKIIALFLLMTAIFLPVGWIGYLLLTVVLLITFAFAKLSFSLIFRAMRPMLFMIIFLFIVNSLTVKTGELWFAISFFAVYFDAVLHTLYIVIRLFLMVMLTTLLTATTKPLDLTLGLEYLMEPWQRFKVPSHEIALMISIALRYIPTILEETVRIMNAQKSRGVDFEEGSLKEKLLAMLSLIIPLFTVAFARADDLANAMEARGYIPGAQRTRYKQLRYHSRDYYFLGICIMILGGSIVLSFL